MIPHLKLSNNQVFESPYFTVRCDYRAPKFVLRYLGTSKRSLEFLRQKRGHATATLVQWPRPTKLTLEQPMDVPISHTNFCSKLVIENIQKITAVRTIRMVTTPFCCISSKLAHFRKQLGIFYLCIPRLN